MKTPTIIVLALLAHSAFADPNQVKIEASYSRFDRSWFTPWIEKGEKKFHSPTVTTKFGKTASIVNIQSISSQISPLQKATIDRGIILEITPYFKDGKLSVYGKSIIRQSINSKRNQPMSAKSFITRETYFSGTVVDREPMIISSGNDRSEKGDITLVFTLLRSDGTPHKK